MKGLSKYDVEIFIVFFSGYKTHGEKKAYGTCGVLDNNIKYIYCSNQQNYNIWINRINLYLLSSIHSLINAFKLKDIIKTFNPDLILIPPTLEVFRVVTKVVYGNKLRCKLMMDITEFNDALEGHTTNVLQRRKLFQFNRYLTRRIFPVLDLCLVITDALKRHYSQLPGINPNILFLKVPITVDFDRFEGVDTTCTFPKPYIAYTGSSSYVKDGIDILIHAFVNISEQYPDLKLLIAAFWENDGQKMVDLIESTGLSERIIYLGALNSDEIPILLINAKILAMPRPNSRQASGGFPTKLGEYLASGNPVCVTKVSEISNYLVDNESAYLAEPGDIESFTDAMRRAMSNDCIAKQVGENGRKVARSYFDINIHANRVFKFIVKNSGIINRK